MKVEAVGLGFGCSSGPSNKKNNGGVIFENLKLLRNYHYKKNFYLFFRETLFMKTIK